MGQATWAVIQKYILTYALASEVEALGLDFTLSSTGSPDWYSCCNFVHDTSTIWSNDAESETG